MIENFKRCFIALLVLVMSVNLSASDHSSSSSSDNSSPLSVYSLNWSTTEFQPKQHSTHQGQQVLNNPHELLPFLTKLQKNSEEQQATISSLTHQVTTLETHLSDTKKELATLKALVENLPKQSPIVNSPHRNNIVVTNNSMMGNSSLFLGSIYSGNTYTGDSNYDWLEPIALIGALGFAVYVAWACAQPAVTVSYSR